jgi:hypothetical protein
MTGIERSHMSRAGTPKSQMRSLSSLIRNILEGSRSMCSDQADPATFGLLDKVHEATFRRSDTA